jgi:hypothetical protein
MCATFNGELNNFSELVHMAETVTNLSRKEQVIRKAAELFKENGYAAASMRDLACIRTSNQKKRSFKIFVLTWRLNSESHWMK